jgi:adenylate cyclase
MAEQRVQRRLAAILAADVVGYSRLMRDDGTCLRAACAGAAIASASLRS